MPNRMMLLTAIAAMPACAAYRPTHYEGYVVDAASGRGVGGLEIRLELSQRVDGYTDGGGYFKVPKRPTGLENIYVARAGRVLDTLHTLIEHTGEQRETRFVSRRKDTAFLTRR